MSELTGVRLTAKSKKGEEFIKENYSKKMFGYTLLPITTKPLCVDIIVVKAFRKSVGAFFVDALYKRFGEKMNIKRKDVEKHVLVVLV
jgi:hypothetical protein